ncbi:hypothetical protein SAY86_017684 [Trapa natans]|uniref:Uncharacterized protein n=1 Tax=Trapa natans TaxID=22666 RepID=A0AAN7LQL3_TRANT|nr:hypothetical protein SAY86_017684 [Trapa natans]
MAVWVHLVLLLALSGYSNQASGCVYPSSASTAGTSTTNTTTSGTNPLFGGSGVAPTGINDTRSICLVELHQVRHGCELEEYGRQMTQLDTRTFKIMLHHVSDSRGYCDGHELEEYGRQMTHNWSIR